MSRPDPERLEQGLRQLRELGYLSTPASATVARSVGVRRSLPRAVFVSSVWIGAGTGWVFALLLTASALLADPGLRAWPRSLAILFLDLGLVLSLLFGMVTAIFSTAVLLRHRGRRGIQASATERALVLVPGLLATLYLVDRIGRSVLEGAKPGSWIFWATVLVLFGAVFAMVLSGTMRSALAMVRLQLRGAYSPPRVSGRERVMPAVVGAVLSVILLLAGPYRPGSRAPWFEEVPVELGGETTPLLVVAIDGLVSAPVIEPLDPARQGRAVPEEGLAPTAYWNEIATGFVAAEHGLASASTPAPRGWALGGERLREDPVLATLVNRLLPGVGLAREQAADRRELRRPPVWEIAARAGLRARVVNWWGSYPAATRPGLEVVTDRQWLRHARGADPDSALAAPDYLLLDDAEVRARATRSGAFLDSLAPTVARLEAPPGVTDVLALAAGADLYHLERAREVLVVSGPELVMVLLSGPDILARATAGSAAGLEPLRRAYERLLARQIASLVRDAGRETWVLAVGRSPDGSATGTWSAGPWTEEPAAAASRILGALGIPVARDMVGAEDPAAPPTYGLLRPAGDNLPRAEPDLEQLRSLGYIGD